ncbi:MAG TPA: cation:proton antiporter [Ktedonobacteraceae bacterium]|jgi:CPA1 family monovalent cation:H+ antiporter|nr:cation:proton antiporter [Ktedonobacteraceae bacterium]
MVSLSLIIRDLVFFLLIALVVAILTKRLAIPDTLGLVVVGVFLGFLKLTPEAQLTPDLVLFVFLPPLLFEGAWAVNLSLLRENWRVIFFLAGPGLLLSLVIIAAVFHVAEQLDWFTALLLGAILSPTDPVAVLGLFRQLHVNHRLSTIIESESLFNDGVAGSLYQTFLALLLLSLQGHTLSAGAAWGQGLLLLLQNAGGGLLFGVLGGLLISQGLKRLDDPVLETTVTLLVAYGLYWLADTIHVSAIVTVIVAGLILGNYGRSTAMSARSQSDVETFWRMLAFLANALIFLLIGVQVHPLTQQLFSSAASSIWSVALFAIGGVLLARLALVLVLGLRFWLRFSYLAKRGERSRETRQPFPRSWGVIIFWSGLRGALSLALVLALPVTLPSRDILVISTYAVVLFTLLVQGFSLRWVLRRVLTKKLERVPTVELEETEIIEEGEPA